MARLIEAPLAAPCTVQWKPQVPAVENVWVKPMVSPTPATTEVGPQSWAMGCTPLTPVTVTLWLVFTLMHTGAPKVVEKSNITDEPPPVRSVGLSQLELA